MSSFDRTHVLAVSYVYELPFARNSKGLARHLFQGWQISGINSIQSGNPLTITIPGDRAGVGSTSQRPDIVCADYDGQNSKALVQPRVVRATGARHIRKCRTKHCARTRH